MNDTVIELAAPSKLEKLKKIVKNRKVQVGATIVTTVVVTVLVLRSEVVGPRIYTLDEVTEVVNDVIADNATA